MRGREPFLASLRRLDVRLLVRLPTGSEAPDPLLLNSVRFAPAVLPDQRDECETAQILNLQLVCTAGEAAQLLAHWRVTQRNDDSAAIGQLAAKIGRQFLGSRGNDNRIERGLIGQAQGSVSDAHVYVVIS